MNKLPVDQREAIMLVGGAGMSYEEAAEVCDCALGTIKSRVSRARTALLRILESENEHDLLEHPESRIVTSVQLSATPKPARTENEREGQQTGGMCSTRREAYQQ